MSARQLPEELLDRWWDRLDKPLAVISDPESERVENDGSVAIITRGELAEALLDFALLAMWIDPVRTDSPRPLGSLQQSLLTMGEQAEEKGLPGWGVICRRTAAFAVSAANLVTRLLPAGQMVVQDGRELEVASVGLREDGRLACSLKAEDGSIVHLLAEALDPIFELKAAPATDATAEFFRCSECKMIGAHLPQCSIGKIAPQFMA